MLKTKRGSQIWLITQPADSELAGVMAAHWGSDEFAAPVVDPYPFDQSPLLLAVPARVVEPNRWWRKAPWTLRELLLLRPQEGTERISRGGSHFTRLMTALAIQ
jgi:hypothetical protein